MKRDAMLALDFGGTKLAVGLADPATRSWLVRERTSTPSNAEETLTVINAIADRLIRSTSSRAVGVGVSFGGHIDAATGIVLSHPFVPGWDDLSLASTLAEHFDAPCRAVNDGAAGALGEWRFGAAQGFSDVVYITVSTGVGGGLILGGRPYSGAMGLAGEFGHLPVPGASAPCECGSSGCLEAISSGRAIAGAAYARLQSGETTSLRGISGRVTAKDVSEHAHAGDHVSMGLLAEAGAAVGEIASMIATAFDPQILLIGGGVAQAGAVFWASMQGAFRTPLHPDGVVQLAAAAHTDEAPLNGAKLLALAAASGTTAHATLPVGELTY